MSRIIVQPGHKRYNVGVFYLTYIPYVSQRIFSSSSPKSSYQEIDEPEVMLEKPSSVNLNDRASDDSIGTSPLPSSFQGCSSQSISCLLFTRCFLLSCHSKILNNASRYILYIGIFEGWVEECDRYCIYIMRETFDQCRTNYNINW